MLGQSCHKNMHATVRRVAWHCRAEAKKHVLTSIILFLFTKMTNEMECQRDELLLSEMLSWQMSALIFLKTINQRDVKRVWLKMVVMPPHHWCIWSWWGELLPSEKKKTSPARSDKTQAHDHSPLASSIKSHGWVHGGWGGLWGSGLSAELHSPPNVQSSEGCGGLFWTL